MNLQSGQSLLSELVAHSKYAKYLPSNERRETRLETIERNYQMHLKRYPHIKDELDIAYGLIKDRYFVPSMRSLQFGGEAIERINERVFNCSFLNLVSPVCFSELMFLLLCGTGVGYSVKRRHVEQMPALTKPSREVQYVIHDSIEGWADAVKELISAYMENKPLPVFVTDGIRKKGTRLSTGIIAPGPEKLAQTLENVKRVLDIAASDNRKLTPLEAHDIACYIAEAVVSGGVRRSAMICLFDWNDDEMLMCKVEGNLKGNEQRYLSNNSAHILKGTPETKAQYDYVVARIKEALCKGSGDPGIYLTNDLDQGTNPCGEISLQENFCNLTDINGKQILTQKDFNTIARYASLVGTLQASFTDFKYLRPVWRERTEREALIGVGITSLVEGACLDLDMRHAAIETVKWNTEYANMIGINPAWRTTTIKPSGTSTLYLGNMASGCHDVPITSDTEYYIRRMRVGKTEPIYHYLLLNMPELIEDCVWQGDTTAVVSIPMDARGELKPKIANTPIEFLERVKYLNDNWILPGHVRGVNTNNVSATCNVSPSDHEEVFEWLWNNNDHYMGMSVLPKWELDGVASHAQMPIEPCSKERFDNMSEKLVTFSAESVYEPEDTTKLVENLACAGGACEIVNL
jgi:ribonucleoside-diphosphate reductase alpha chain